MVEEQASSISAGNISVKTKVKNLSNEDSVEDVNTDLEVPGFPQHKGRVKKSAAESNTVEFQIKTVTTEKGLSIRSDEVPGA